MATKIQVNKQTNQLRTIPAHDQTLTQNVKYNLAL